MGLMPSSPRESRRVAIEGISSTVRSDIGAQMGTFALVPQVKRAVNVPSRIAAGGIAEARGVAAAMALGADAVQVGTAYLLCTEATTSPVHRAALKSEAAPQYGLP